MKADDINVICDQYTTKSANSTNNSIRKYTSSGNPRVSIHDDRYNEYVQSEFKAAMSGVYIVTPIATPVTYQIDPVTLKTLRGLNNVWSSANGNIDLSYWTH